MERSTYYKIAVVVGSLALSSSAFGRPIRRKIIERDQTDVWDGSTTSLESAHINHSRSTEVYNSETNGRLLKTKNHYIDHFNRHGTETLGLNEEANKWSLKSIWARLTEAEKSELPPPEEVGKTIIPIVIKKK